MTHTPDTPPATPATGHVTAPDGTRIAYSDTQSQGGSSPSSPLLLLHGLAGHMGEWDDLTARLQADGRRVVRYDARGHAASTRRPRDMTRASCVADAVAVIEHLSLAPVTLVGQSLGGHTAFLTAVAHPHLVDTLILIEAGPSGPSPNLPTEIDSWLDKSPVSFVDRDMMVAAVAELAERSYWAEWQQVRCPTFVVRGAQGTMPASELTEMRNRRATSKTKTKTKTMSIETEVIEDAGHDVHLDQPERLYGAVRGFLARGTA
ncbi:alpha/beta fold hydrolase [Streptomyces ureilyticus]|uniref:Alpha/beta hydrolase n=1 Tax=Streptomyces ureilyticus TaxID=1775131 RepID=A0ABX0DXB7_9ACTN|nr:alpha/beta hydrolase [Streptomyces ureilyticus]NGO45524.1 alpha/beta hydrolase [Streptomyces ureilyticus]